jgi:hypothetical protein
MYVPQQTSFRLQYAPEHIMSKTFFYESIYLYFHFFMYIENINYIRYDIYFLPLYSIEVAHVAETPWY